MLVLSRKPGETVRIDGDIKVHVLEVRGNTIRLGFEAPSDVTIVRGEVEDCREKRETESLDLTHH